MAFLILICEDVRRYLRCHSPTAVPLPALSCFVLRVSPAALPCALVFLRWVGSYRESLENIGLLPEKQTECWCIYYRNKFPGLTCLKFIYAKNFGSSIAWIWLKPLEQTRWREVEILVQQKAPNKVWLEGEAWRHGNQRQS